MSNFERADEVLRHRRVGPIGSETHQPENNPQTSNVNVEQVDLTGTNPATDDRIDHSALQNADESSPLEQDDLWPLEGHEQQDVDENSPPAQDDLSPLEQPAETSVTEQVNGSPPPELEAELPSPPLVPIVYGPPTPPPNLRRAVRERSRRTVQVFTLRASTAYMLICIYYILLVAFVHIRLNTYPEPKYITNSNDYEFTEETALKHVEKIAGLGTRMPGGKPHRRAEAYILHSLRNISSHCLPQFTLDIDVQRVSGTFTIPVVSKGGITSVYSNSTNIVARLRSMYKARHSVLVNCHYDTAIDSPGVGSSAVGCSVMLEALRAMSRKPHLRLIHDVVFLFQGEGHLHGLLSSSIGPSGHGFLTQHPWASNVQVDLRLDAVGAGGPEIVFQNGPGQPWLVTAYAMSAPHPHALCLLEHFFNNVHGRSLFNYSIVRDYGHVPGLKVMQYANGYVYQTRNDKPDIIPPGCLQRYGDNLVPLILQLATSYKLYSPKKFRPAPLIYFDFVGLFMVNYSLSLAALINWATIVFIYVSFLKRLFRDQDPGRFLRLTILACLCHMMTWLAAVITALCASLLVGNMGWRLSYYTHNLNVVWLYVLPPVTVVLALHLAFKRTLFKTTEPGRVVVVLQEANLLLWSAILAVCTEAGLSSSYLPLLAVLGPTFTFIPLELMGLRPTNVLFSLIGSFVPSVYVIYVTYILLRLFLPITGQIGMDKRLDVFIVILSCLPVLACLPYHIGFVYTHKRVARIVSINSAVCWMGLVAVIYTPSGFPFSSSEGAFQRAGLVHVDRSLHAWPGHTVLSDAHVWFLPRDSVGIRPVGVHNPTGLLTRAHYASCIGVYCGRSYLYPDLGLRIPYHTYRLPASHLDYERLRVNVTSRFIVDSNDVRLFCTVKVCDQHKATGPTYMTLRMSEMPKVRIVDWSIGDQSPVRIVDEDSSYFIIFSQSGCEPWHFSVDLKVKGTKVFTTPLIKMSVAQHLRDEKSMDLLSVESELPPWVTPISWVVIYDEYEF